MQVRKSKTQQIFGHKRHTTKEIVKVLRKIDRYNTQIRRSSEYKFCIYSITQVRENITQQTLGFKKK